MLKIKGRIAVACCVPLLGLLGFATAHLVASWAALQQSNAILRQVDLVAATDDLIHQLQQERGASSGYLASGGAKMGGALQTARPGTDKALTAYKQRLDLLASKGGAPDLVVRAKAFEQSSAAAQAMRPGISQMAVTQPVAVAAFTDAISSD